MCTGAYFVSKPARPCRQKIRRSISLILSCSCFPIVFLDLLANCFWLRIGRALMKTISEHCELGITVLLEALFCTPQDRPPRNRKTCFSYLLDRQTIAPAAQRTDAMPLINGNDRYRGNAVAGMYDSGLNTRSPVAR